MTISTVLIWFLIATAIVVAIPSMWMVCYALAPTRTQDYRDTASCGVIPNLLIGLIPAVVTFFGVAAILQARKGPAVGLVLAVAGLVLMWSLMGAGGIALLVGDRLWPGDAPEHKRQQILRGGALIMGCCLLPVIGWFVLLPALAVTGLGILVHGFIRKQRVPSDPSPHHISSESDTGKS